MGLAASTDVDHLRGGGGAAGYERRLGGRVGAAPAWLHSPATSAMEPGLSAVRFTCSGWESRRNWLGDPPVRTLGHRAGQRVKQETPGPEILRCGPDEPARDEL
jgi:hypothetical protein